MTNLVSFVIPARNEQESLPELVDKIVANAGKLASAQIAEVVLIDDGSTDRTWAAIQSIAKKYPDVVRAIRFRRNLGKAFALQAGFQRCTGSIVFTMDADLQDDPNEIPRFIDRLNEGYDLVSGWKRVRNDPLSKTLPSRIFNRVTSWLTGIRLRDFNCGFKCYRVDVVRNIRLYGELHRYIPVLAADLGYRIGEMEVTHHPRLHGRSKYGWHRYARGLLDLFTVIATTRWLNKPGHLFGGIAIILGLLGGGSLAYLAVLWLIGEGPIGQRPLLTFGVLMSIGSIQMFSLGIMTELFMRQQGPHDIGRYVSESIDGPDASLATMRQAD